MEMAAASAGGSGRQFVRLFVCGDVMLGRGVDQMLNHHVTPVLYEDYVRDARDYLGLCVQQNGPLPNDRSVSYVWGDALQVLERMQPDYRLINLETSITDRGQVDRRKGVHYRMHPLNVDVIQAANIDCCVLGNNHVLDWGMDGLQDTLTTLERASVSYVGAGRCASAARQPLIVPLPAGGKHRTRQCYTHHSQQNGHHNHTAADGEEDVQRTNGNGRLLIFSISCPTAGVASGWTATDTRPGVWYVDTTDPSSVRSVAATILSHKQPNDIVVLSIHWGSNWGWQLDSTSVAFAQRLIDCDAVQFVYGHSSHHIRPVMLHQGKLIALGCGDFLSDYEGIHDDGSNRQFRDDLSLMYFVDLDVRTGCLVDLHLVPMRLKNIRVQLANQDDERWLYDNMRRECAKYYVNIERVNVDRLAGASVFRWTPNGNDTTTTTGRKRCTAV